MFGIVQLGFLMIDQIIQTNLPPAGFQRSVFFCGRMYTRSYFQDLPDPHGNSLFIPGQSGDRRITLHDSKYRIKIPHFTLVSVRQLVCKVGLSRSRARNDLFFQFRQELVEFVHGHGDAFPEAHLDDLPELCRVVE